MNSLATPLENLLITTVDDGPFFIGNMFRRKFGDPAPEHGTHVICFYRSDWDHFLPVSYLNFLPWDEVILVGGGMTDGRAFAHMSGDLAEQIRESGGMLYHMLRFGFHHFRDQCEAYFGHAGDPRAYEVDLRAGFEPTGHENLIAHFHKPISTDRRAFLIEKIRQIGAF